MATQLKILIVDDDIDFCNLLAELIKTKIGVEPRRAHTGLEAERIAMEWQPNIMITDTNMPEKNGIDLIRDVAPKLPSMRIILLFNGLDNSDLGHHDVVRMGVFMVITKEELHEKLIPSLQALIAGQHLYLAMKKIFSPHSN